MVGLPYALAEVDRTFLHEFETCVLPFDRWTHRAHVRVGYLYLRQHPFAAALAHVRTGIQAYNAANQVPENPTSGYNETTTHAFLHLIAATLASYETDDPAKDSEGFCDEHPQLMTSRALRFFYSRQRRMLPTAKTQFVEPDLAPLPKLLAPENTG